MSRVLLCRHGHVEGIAPVRFRGRAEIALTPRGRAEAQALASRVAGEWKVSAIYASPLQRCMQTAAAIAERTGATLAAHSGLQDIDYGAWQWKTHDEARRSDPELFAAWLELPWLVRFPKGESLQDLLLRTADILRLVIQHHPAETVVLVGHESVNRAMLLQVLDRPLAHYWDIRQAPCTINEFEITAHSVQVFRIDDSDHLANLNPAD